MPQRQHLDALRFRDDSIVEIETNPGQMQPPNAGESNVAGRAHQFAVEVK